jgi:hypothetical protein
MVFGLWFDVVLLLYLVFRLAVLICFYLLLDLDTPFL